MKPATNFKDEVAVLVSHIPDGRVMTYGQIAALCGHPRAARQVGQVAHFGAASVPWHRVVNRVGQLASGYHGGRSTQAQLLEQEGVKIVDDIVCDFHSLVWYP